MLKWKHESGGLCRCCLAEGAYKNLSSVFNWMQQREVYSEMLREVFDISLTQVDSQEQESGFWSICDECVGKLREANTFKKQVLASENRFRELYHPSKDDIEIKSEEPDPEVKSEDYVSTGADDLDNFLDSDDEFLATSSKKAKKTKSKPEKESQPKKKRGRKPKAKVKEEAETNAENSAELKAEEAAGPADENNAKADEGGKKKEGTSEQPKKKDDEEASPDMTRSGNEKPGSETARVFCSQIPLVVGNEICSRKDNNFQRPNDDSETQQTLRFQNSKDLPPDKSDRSSKDSHDEKDCVDLTETSLDGSNVNGTSQPGVLEPNTSEINKTYSPKIIEDFNITRTDAADLSQDVSPPYAIGLFQNKYNHTIRNRNTEHTNMPINLSIRAQPSGYGMANNLNYEQIPSTSTSFESGYSHMAELPETAIVRNANEIKTEAAYQVNLEPMEASSNSLAVTSTPNDPVNAEYNRMFDSNRAMESSVDDSILQEFLPPLIDGVDFEKLDENKFECKLCNLCYLSRNSVRNHIRQKHYNLGHIPCKICPQKFHNYSSVRRHIIDYHKLEPEHFVCEICQKPFTRKAFLERHIKSVHLGEKNISCTVCGFKVFDKGCLKSHMKTHRELKVYHCEGCNKTLSRLETYEQHKRFHAGERAHKCSFCQKAFVRSAGLNLHLKRFHSEGAPLRKKYIVGLDYSIRDQTKVVCMRCEEEFICKSDVYKHIKEKHDVIIPGAYECTECSEKFVRRNVLKDHMEQIHHVEEKHACDQCDGVFSSKYTLTNHKRSEHNDEKRFHCECGHATFTLREMNKHKKLTHLKKEILECEICGKRCKDRRNYLAHKSYAHRTNENKHMCRVCGHHFSIYSNMMKHMSFHLHKKDIICPFCDVKLEGRETLGAHFRRTHPLLLKEIKGVPLSIISEPKAKRSKANDKKVTDDNLDTKVFIKEEPIEEESDETKLLIKLEPVVEDEAAQSGLEVGVEVSKIKTEMTFDDNFDQTVGFPTHQTNMDDQIEQSNEKNFDNKDHSAGTNVFHPSCILQVGMTTESDAED